MAEFELQEAVEQDVFYERMTRVFLRIIFSALGVVAAYLATQDITGYNTVMVVIVLLFLLVLEFVVSSDTHSLVFGMLLWSLVILVTNFVWSYNGIYNSAVMVFPGVLVLAIIYNRDLLFYSLLVFIVCVCLSLGFGHGADLIPLQGFDIGSAWPRVGFTIILTLILSGLVRLFFRVIERYLVHLHKTLVHYKSLHQRYKGEIGFDKLMQLPTEYSCSQVFGEFMAGLNSPSNILGCLLINIKNLEQLKFSLGHKITEKLLVQVGRKFSEFADDNTRVFIFRGNEFVVLSRAKTVDELEKLAQRFLLCVTESVSVENHEIELAAGVGVSLAPFDGDDMDALLKAAHLACDKANSDISSNYLFFDEGMRASADFSYMLIKDMKQALIDGEFQLHYQPKIHLETGDVVGVEALIRWNKAGKGMIPPDAFIPLAEESGLIVEIGKWVLREACAQCKAWHRAGLPRLSVAVNVSPVQFRKGNFPYVVMQALHDADLKPEWLEVEITESALGSQYSTIRSQVKNLASKGVAISVDDFGTGYSNLGHLGKFSISCLKIDQSFIRNSHKNPQDLHIIKAVLQMSKGLGLSNVAEGIEDLEHLQMLRVLGCGYGQGYYWSKPLPCEQFVEFMSAYKPVPLL